MKEQLLRLKDVMTMTSLGSSTIYRYIKAGTFPAQVKIGGYSARWLRSDIEAWIENLIHREIKHSGSGAHIGVSAATLEENAKQSQSLRR